LELLPEDEKIRVRWKISNEIYICVICEKYLKNLPKIQDFSEEKLSAMMERI
jgi:hypothetical protein